MIADNCWIILVTMCVQYSPVSDTSQLTRQTIALMLTTRSAPARELAKLIYHFADDAILCEHRATAELDAWRLLFQQAIAQLRSDEGLAWDAEVSL